MTRMRNPRRFAPYPDMVDPVKDGYRVVDISEVEMPRGQQKSVIGNTDKINHILALPLSEEGVHVGRHEMGHAAWSPNKKPDMRSDLAKACMECTEEARVNLGLLHCNLPIEVPGVFAKVALQSMMRSMQQGKLASVVLNYVSEQGTDLQLAHRELLQAGATAGDEVSKAALKIATAFRRKIGRARLRTGGAVPTFKQGLRIAKWLEKELTEESEKQKKPPEDMQGEGKQVVRVMMGGFGRSMSMKQEATMSKFYRDSKGSRSTPSGKYKGWGGPGGGKSPWNDFMFGEAKPGTMEIRRPKLSIPLIDPTLEKVTHARSADEGTEFRYIERFVSDQRVFKRRAKKRKGGGTVLVDVSSTMDLSDEAVMEIVADCPQATTVATYCGLSQGTGELRIVVDKGKRASPEDVARRYGNGNVIDVPALDWLSCQPEPRVWMSDANVTGKQHSSSHQLRAVCRSIIDENSIVRARGVEGVKQALLRQPLGRQDRANEVWRDPGDPPCEECKGIKTCRCY